MMGTRGRTIHELHAIRRAVTELVLHNREAHASASSMNNAVAAAEGRLHRISENIVAYRHVIAIRYGHERLAAVF